MIQSKCKQLRISLGITQKEFCGDDVAILTISAFENGRSSNIKHLQRYIDLARKHNVLYNFLQTLGDDQWPDQ